MTITIAREHRPPAAGGDTHAVGTLFRIKPKELSHSDLAPMFTVSLALWLTYTLDALRMAELDKGRYDDALTKALSESYTIEGI